jgi:outer membrane biosynthesis protein TonB
MNEATKKKGESLKIIIGCFAVTLSLFTSSYVYAANDENKQIAREVGNYKMNAAIKISQNWAYSKEASSEDDEDEVLVEITILRSGAVKNIIFIKMAENPETNRSIKKAILKAAPFDPFPQSFVEDQLLLRLRPTPKGF